MLEAAIEAGADECDSDDTGHELTCAPDDFNEVREALEKQLGAAMSAELAWKPNTTVDVNEEQAETLFKLIDALEENDDVQKVAANFEVSSQIMERLSA